MLRCAATAAAVSCLGLLVNPGTGLAVTVGAGLVPGIADKTHVQEAYGNLPLYFIRNDGQIDPRVKFYERSSGRTTFFTEDGVYILLGRMKAEGGRMNLPSPQRGEGRVRGDLRKMHDSKPEPHEYQMVKLLPLGANKSPKIVAEDMQAGKVNYFIGNDPKQWRTDVPTYKSVLYQEAYAGIDIRFYGINRQMEYDIVVKPGADPSQVKLAYEGVEGLKVADNGDLEIALKDGGKLIQKKPYIYQEIGGKRVELAGRFNVASPLPLGENRFPAGARVRGENGVGADVSVRPRLDTDHLFGGGHGGPPLRQLRKSYSYDNPPHLNPLPSRGEEVRSFGLSQAESLKGNDSLKGFGLGTDRNIEEVKRYIYTFEVAAYDKAKPLIIDPALAYSTYLGGSDYEWGLITVDGYGCAYVAGITASSDFPVTNNAIQSQYAGGYDVFVTKINAAGTALTYSTYLGGDARDNADAIAVDSAGNAYITGVTFSANFPTYNPIQDSLIGTADAFVAKINAAGDALTYSTYLGGSGVDWGTGIAVDSNGCAYVSGGGDSTDFPVTDNAVQKTYSGGTSDMFVTKINAAGTALVYSTYLGGSGYDASDDGSIAVDSNGCAYVTGLTASTDFPTHNPIQGTYGGGAYDAFVAKINAAGTALTYSTYLGGSGFDQGHDIAVDSAGCAYVAGNTASTNFPTKNPIQGTYGGGVTDTFVAKINAAGTALSYSTYLGGSGEDDGYGIAVDSAGCAYITGDTTSTNFPTKNPVQGTYGGGAYDAFVTKINAAGTALTYSTYLGGSDHDNGNGIAVDSAGSVYVTGRTYSTDFPTTAGAFQGSLAGTANAFVTKINDSNCPNPLAPASITYPAIDCPGNFIVNWSSAAGAVSYVLQRASNPQFINAVTIYNGSALSRTQTGMPGGIYYYRVKATNACGSSLWRTGPVIIVGKPGAPASINYPTWNRTVTDTVIWWWPVKKATGYVLQRATNSLFTGAVTVYSGSDILYVDNLTDGKYYYRVKSTNNCGNSGWMTGGHVIKISQDPQ